MSSSAAPLWKRILYYEITTLDRRTWNYCFGIHVERRKNAVLAAGFDGKWLRRAVTLFALLLVANFLPFHPVIEWIAAGANIGFSCILLFYFALILFRSVQCS